MDSQQIRHLFFMFTWILVFFLPSVCSGMDAPKMRLENTIFVAFAAEGYKEPKMFSYTELITVATFTSVMLIFSVIGSVYVFRGYWKEKMTESGDRQKTSRKPKDNREEKKKEDMDETHADVMATQSTSFYASLETRPRSIYDVLDHSAASRETDRRKPKPKKKNPPKTVEQTTEQQDEGVFECVYENF
ncbi:uncharacterized protein si:ch211-243a20.4 isoform X2 [Acanthochromis polyacanthus]|uniref:uncharacterized protein si:ch211-243a20.4 isoform X2 n=1 Tax=Acanthochromis polyacanthus TaxID=80966 RepID=UPI0022343B07|nr:uncharacterized protein si:ch211-243a20.4 isoform X2 [Acanthochromis polyacanthus]